MKILITGATGFVGRPLVKKLLKAGHQVVVTTRRPNKIASLLGPDVQAFAWNAPHGDFPVEALNGVESVINLMGENIAGKRWSDQQKLLLRESRITGTKKLVQAVAQHAPQLKSFCSTSAIGYYPVNLEQSLAEDHVAGENFLAALCVDWEASLKDLPESVRTCIIRVGVVLGKNGGALGKLLPLFKLGLGGPVGDGKQMMSWIHLDDLTEIYLRAVTDSSWSGVFNGVAPKPVSNREFTKALARAVRRPALFPAPAAALKLAMGELSTIVLDSQTIDCAHLKEKNFTFHYPQIQPALEEIARS